MCAIGRHRADALRARPYSCEIVTENELICAERAVDKESETMDNTATATRPAITKADVETAQKAWGDGIVAIGETFTAGGDYKARAAEHIRTLYAYDHGGVLFKPTLASERQFRNTFDDALSYFVTGHIGEDGGFAIKPWSNVRFGEQDVLLQDANAVAMGNYYFTPVGETEETKVEFTFVYIRDDSGALRISVHHSSLPYTPA